ncbi:MAG: hydrogenase [Candidatus Anammoximicrobium sp.]|mgnify:CR=1 FL=1|nr:hydrogenase [Candidatus Anammoximicrobium sp.]
MPASITEFILIVVMLTNLALLGMGRLRSSIRLVAIQGMVLGALPLLVSTHGLTWPLLVIAAGSFGLKGLAFPWWLTRTLRATNAQREASPVVGPSASTALGALLIVFSFWIGARFQLPPGVPLVSRLAMPVAVATLLSGLFVIVTRRQALMQVLGYLVLENGIFVFGLALAHEEPLLVEMGILLDVFVAVFVMGIAVFHIAREFDHIDVQKLSELRD